MNLSGTLLTLALLLAGAAQSGQSTSRIIANALYIEAAGCESRAQHFDITIPDAAKLDRGHAGIVPGIELQETTRVNRAGVRNIIFNGSVLSFDMFAEGEGTIQGGGEILGVKIPKTCLAPKGASYGVKVVAFYK